MSFEASRWLVIVNPASGGGRTGRRWPQLQSALADAGVDFDCATSTTRGEGEVIARGAVRGGRRRIIIVGGDGSAHDVINGVMDAAPPADDPVTLAIAPSGTGDDWAHGLGMPRNARRIAQVIAGGDSVAHDVGLLRWEAQGSVPAGHRWFVNVGGSGFDAWVLARIPQGSRSRSSYLAGALRGLFDYRPGTMTLQAHSTSQAGRFLVVFVAIGPYCGGGMHVAPGAIRDDGQFDVVAIRDPGILGTLRRLPRLYTGAILRDRFAWHLRTDRLRLDSVPPGAVELDGQVTAGTPVEFSCCRAAIRVVLGRRPDKGVQALRPCTP